MKILLSPLCTYFTLTSCRLREKEKLFSFFKDLERQMRDANFELDRDLYPDTIERSWSQLIMLFQVRLTAVDKQSIPNCSSIRSVFVLQTAGLG